MRGIDLEQIQESQFRPHTHYHKSIQKRLKEILDWLEDIDFCSPKINRVLHVLDKIIYLSRELSDDQEELLKPALEATARIIHLWYEWLGLLDIRESSDGIEVTYTDESVEPFYELVREFTTRRPRNIPNSGTNDPERYKHLRNPRKLIDYIERATQSGLKKWIEGEFGGVEGMPIRASRRRHTTPLSKYIEELLSDSFPESQPIYAFQTPNLWTSESERTSSDEGCSSQSRSSFE